MATPNLGFQNYFSTTLTSGITASDTTIYVNSLPTPSEGYLVIEPDSATNREIIYYTSKGANFVTCPSAVAGRGVGGTTAISHNSGSTVTMKVVAEHFEALQDGTAFAVGGIGASAYADGWTPILGVTPNTVTANGNRNYDLVFNSVDLTSTLSPGMRLRLTRTAAAPSQCTDLEASSSQYYNKTSPAGMTFTDDFVVSAWVKLESYPATNMDVVSRYNGTSGWRMTINSAGQVVLVGYNAGAANYSQVQADQAVPLNKWVHVAAQLDMSAFTSAIGTAEGSRSWITLNGVEAYSTVSRGGTNPTALIQAGDLQIGAYNGATSPFDGKIAQVAIYNAKVTQATIKNSMDRTLTGSETSLISAYSFNNTINDLSANANNLTAQGSAVATATDSPFANAVAAGLQEYAIVTAVAFSTNTTVNVQVPYGCQIPTTGGISNVYYSTQKIPFGFPSESDRWVVEFLGRVQFYKTGGTTNVWYNYPGASTSTVGPALRIPTGQWDVRWEAQAYTGTTAQNTIIATLSTSQSSPAPVDARWVTTWEQPGGTTTGPTYWVNHSHPITVTSATVYYLIYKNTVNGASASYLFGERETVVLIEASLGYL